MLIPNVLQNTCSKWGWGNKAPQLATLHTEWKQRPELWIQHETFSDLHQAAKWQMRKLRGLALSLPLP